MAHSRFPVSNDKLKRLVERMLALGVREEDLDEHFVRSSGAGGQNVNKVSSCVVLHHRPSDIRVKCQKERSQGLNRYLARRLLLDKIETQSSASQSTEEQKIEKLRRQKRKRSRRAKLRMLDAKHHQAEKKRRRAAVRQENYDN